MYRNSPFFATKSGKSSPFDMGWKVCSVGECDLEKELSSEALCSSLPGPWLLWTRNDTSSTKPGILPVTGHWVRHQDPGFALIYRGGFGVCQPAMSGDRSALPWKMNDAKRCKISGSSLGFIGSNPTFHIHNMGHGYVRFWIPSFLISRGLYPRKASNQNLVVDNSIILHLHWLFFFSH